VPSPALVTGCGEQVRRLPRTAGDLVIIMPDFGCNTAEVYRAFDALGPAALREPEVSQVAAMPMGRGEHLFNDLARAAEAVEPRLAELRRLCRSLVDRPVHITGSGSTLFVIADDPEHAASMARVLAARVAGLAAAPVRLM
jgi:4-diphosphocytidyl-2-C-methyl-D-erythritol kinase